MAKNYIQLGSVVEWTNDTGSAVASGDRVTMGSQDGVALVDLDDGESGSVAMDGVWDLPKVSGSAWNPGDRLVWDSSESAYDLESNVSLDTGDVSECAVAGGHADSGATTGPVKIGVGVGTVN